MKSSTWTTRNGRVISVKDLEDDHLARILQEGMRIVATRLRQRGLDEYAAGATGDDGMEYIAEVNSSRYFTMAANPAFLAANMARSPRYAPIIAEARARAHAKRTTAIASV